MTASQEMQVTLISYAQNGEDIILWRALRHVERGFYIDIGACDPNDLSVTKLFYEQGWNGINVEPSKEFYDRCVADRPRDVNLNLAVAEQAGMVRFLNVNGTGLSTLSQDNAASAAARGFEVQERVVSALPLSSICGIAGDRDVHFLKIDVEGSEQSVLAGGDFRRFRPWIVVVEATRPNSEERNDTDWRDMLLNADYEQAYFDGINLYFLAREHLELQDRLAVQPNVLDSYRPAVLAEAQSRLAELGHELVQRDVALRDALEYGAKTEAALTQVREQHGIAEAEARRLFEGLEREVAARAALREELATERNHRQREASARRGVQSRLEQERRERERDHAALADLRARLEHTVAERNHLEHAIHGVLGPDAGTGGSLTQRLESAFALHEQRLATAEAQLSRIEDLQQRITASTSWRVTAPLRQAKRIMQEQASAKRGPDPVGKKLARRVFKLGMQAALSVPGARRGVRLASRVAPQPVEWLALRYRAYNSPALSVSVAEAIVPEPVEAITALALPPAQVEAVPELTPLPLAATADMSAEEARIYRQLAVAASSPSATA